MRSIEWGIRNPVTINLIVVVMTIFGILSTIIIQRQLFPTTQKDTVQVLVTLEDASTATQVDENVVQVIQPGIQNVNGIEQTFSIAESTKAQINIDVRAGFDPYRVKDDVEDQVNMVLNKLPDSADPPSTIVQKPINFALYVIITGESPNEWDLAQAANALRSDMIDQNVANQVVTQGIPQYEVRIQVPYEQIQAYGLSMEEVAAQVASFDVQLDAGDIFDPSGQIVIKAPPQKRTERAFANIPIHLGNDEYISLQELCGFENLVNGFVENPAIGRYQGKPAAFVQVSANTHQDLVRLCSRVRKYVAKYTLPDGLESFIAFDMSSVISDQLALILSNGIEGICLVLILMALFLEWKVGFWVALGILFSLTGAMAFLFVTGQSLNMVSLTGFLIAVGVVVDNGLVIGESYYHEREAGANSMDSARGACKELFWPVFAMGIANILVYVPLLFIIGQEGKLIRGIPIVTIAALSLSLLQALIILPPHLAHYGGEIRTLFMATLRFILYPFIWLMNKAKPYMDRGLHWFSDHVLEPSVRFCVHHRYATMLTFCAVFYLTYSMVSLGYEKVEINPPQETNYYTATLQLQPGTFSKVTAGQLDLITAALERTNEHFKEQYGTDSVQFYFTYADDDQGAVVVQLFKPSQGRKATGQEIKDYWYSQIPPIPGSVSMAIESLGVGMGGKDIDVVLYSRDEEALQTWADKTVTFLKGQSGTQSVNQNRFLGMLGAQLTIAPEFFNMPYSESDLMHELYATYNGTKVSTFYRDDREVKVHVRSWLDNRRTVAQLSDLMLPNGMRVGQVADVTIDHTLNTFNRYQGLPEIEVTADVDLSTGANAQVIRDRMREQILDELPEGMGGVRWAWQGSAREAHKAIVSLTAAGIPVALLLYLVLATIFKSYMQPIIILLAVPYGLVGVVWGHMIMGYPISLLSLFGIIALAGLEVNASIVLVDYINQMLRQGLDIEEASVHAARRRLRPIILTAGTAVIGMFPLLIDTSMEVQYIKPIIISIFYGKIVSTVLCMVLIPSAYAILKDITDSMSTARHPYIAS